MAGSGPRGRPRPSWPPSSGDPSPSSAAGRRFGRSTGRSRARGRATQRRRRPKNRRRSKKACRGGGRGGRAPSRRDNRGLRHRRAPGRSSPIAGDIGLKPILRRVWAPRGQRPIARGHHRYEWFYVTAFVSPATGESFWYLSTGVDKELFEDTLALFAREAGAGRDRIILLVLDGAGYHTTPLTVPEGIWLIYLPPYTPELQPAETLWVHSTNPSSTSTSRPSTTSTLSWRRASPWKKTATSSGGRPDSTGG